MREFELGVSTRYSNYENIDILDGDVVEKTAKKVGSEIMDKVFGMFKKKAGNEAAESAGSQIAQKVLQPVVGKLIIIHF